MSHTGEEVSACSRLEGAVEERAQDRDRRAVGPRRERPGAAGQWIGERDRRADDGLNWQRG